MSADNWAICPRCNQDNQREQEKLAKKVDEAYGKVPVDEYLKLRERLENPPKKLDQTLREDYELGIDRDGVFYVAYNSSCKVCGFSHGYEYQQRVEL